MKRKPTSKIWNTATYLRSVRGILTFTAMDLHRAMPDARDWYHNLIPATILKQRDQLCADHNFGHDWDHTHTYDAIGYGPATKELNVALLNLFRPWITMHEPYFSSNFTTSYVTNTHRRGYIIVVATEPFLTYKLNPAYLEM